MAGAVSELVADTARICISKEKLNSPPSRADGIDAATEDHQCSRADCQTAAHVGVQLTPLTPSPQKNNMTTSLIFVSRSPHVAVSCYQLHLCVKQLGMWEEYAAS
eukprot:6052195-Amphidinium_carterae.1